MRLDCSNMRLTPPKLVEWRYGYCDGSFFVQGIRWLYSVDCNQEALGQLVERHARRHPELLRRGQRAIRPGSSVRIERLCMHVCAMSSWCAATCRARGRSALHPVSRWTTRGSVGTALSPTSILGRAQVSRLQSDATRVQLRATLHDSTGTTLESFVLQDDHEPRTVARHSVLTAMWPYPAQCRRAAVLCGVRG